MQIKNCTCKLKNITRKLNIAHANYKYSTCKLKIVLQIENRKHIDAN